MENRTGRGSKLGATRVVGKDVESEDKEGEDACMMLFLRQGRAVPHVPWAGGILSLQISS